MSKLFLSAKVGRVKAATKVTLYVGVEWRSLACVLLVMAEVVDDDRNKIWAWLAWGWRGRWQRFRTHYWYTRLIVLLDVVSLDLELY